MKAYVDIFPQSLQVSYEGQRRSCIIREMPARGGITEKELWFHYPKELSMPEDSDCDSYLLATLLPAMQMKADIIVHGNVSRELLANLTELQHIWHKWLPEEFFLVDIKVDSIRENETRAEGAITAFSGGVDAQFTAYRHAMGRAGYATQPLKAGVLIHGFDIPLTDIQGFSGTERMASVTLDDLNIDLLSVKTNIRDVWDINLNWLYYFGIAVASVLSGLNRYAGIGLIGSSEPYDSLVTPLGSHPMIDPLMSSGTFKIIHDGAGFSRTEKVEVISEWLVGTQNLRVCWDGGKNDRNCGICEKCVRTRLNFVLADSPNPACFNTPLKASMFKNISIPSTNQGQRADWKQVHDDIVNKGKGLEWLPQVKKVLKRKSSPKFGKLLPSGSKRRELVKKILAKNS